ncbi:hypothetical protein WJX84_006068 [Apatococcus fuscideae]|uniref:Uncharacterized protein n=1 Tax=Apatococcus fuscideae TaxID=2026836 RepID=A0AAW1T2F3_9CHLO
MQHQGSNGSASAGLIAPFYFKSAIDCLGDGASKAAIGAATAALLWSGFCRVVNGIAKEVQHPIFTPVSQAAGRRVAYHTFSHVLDLDLAFHLERRTGTLTRILERGTRAVAMVFRAVVFTFIPTFVELVLVCGLLARTFRPLVSIMVVATFVAYVTWTLYMTTAATEARKQVLKLDNLYTNKAVDALLNYETVKLFNNEALEVSQYDEYLVGYQKASVENEKIYAALNGGQSVILAMGLTSILIAAATSAGTFTAGDLVMAQGLLLQLWGPLSFLGWFYRELRQSLVDMEAFFGILSQTTNLPDGSRPLPASSNLAAPASSSHLWDGHHSTAHDRHQGSHAAAEGMPPSSSNGRTASAASNKGLRVELKDVRFAYNSGREVLKGINLTIEPGQSVAFVGGSGSGKSTVLKLLMRLYDVSSGTVHVNGVDVRELKQSSYRSAVAVVPQDTVLFNDTILRNVAYGRPQASNDEIVQAAEMARLGESIGRMPEGYNTMAGERGLKLSGGEKSRVAIARAFLRNPRLLICDEATAALDTVTEQAIMRSLNELAEGRTCVFVAHRLSTIQGCDKIVVMRGQMAKRRPALAPISVPQSTRESYDLYVALWRYQDAEKELYNLKFEDLKEVALLGRGSSGVVRKVHHGPTGKDLVLKVIQFDTRQEQVRKQVSMELRTLAEANHRSIVRFYQSFLNDGAVVIVMEHMDAGSMADVLQKHRSISEPYLAQIALQASFL